MGDEDEETEATSSEVENSGAESGEVRPPAGKAPVNRRPPLQVIPARYN